MYKLAGQFCLFAFIALGLSIVSEAQSQSTAKPTAGDEPIAAIVLSPSGVTWLPHTEYSSLVLTISTPNGGILRQDFSRGVNPSFNVTNQNGFTRTDGHYTYELRLVPVLSAETRASLAASRDSGNNDVVVRQLQETGQLPAQAVTQSGSFLVTGGMVFSNASAENLNRQSDSLSTPRQANMAAIGPLPNDQVTADDLIVQGSACIGLDCVNGESFGFDTLRLKENNTRIAFSDTSTSAGFASNDWQLTANDSASGGANKFSIDDITGAKTPFTVIAGAPTNSFFLNNLGKLGLRTATPALDIHMNTVDTPAVRFEQNSSGGFTAQTWDIGANEANFFVRDFTGGSRLPFRIRPGAPTSSIDIAGSGNVGIGTASPGFKLDVVGSINATSFFLNGTPFNPTSFNSGTGTTTGQIAKWTDNAGTLGNSVISEASGSIGIGTPSPGSLFSEKLTVNGAANILAGNNLYFSNPGNTNAAIIKTSSTSGITAADLHLVGGSGNGIFVQGDGKIGVGTTAPQSTLQVNGYVQLALTSGAPPAVDCDNAAEYGRMKVDATGSKLYVCTSAGWRSTTLVP